MPIVKGELRTMATPTTMTRPQTLIEDRQYLLKVSHSEMEIPIFTLVIFSAYTACPGIVVVRDGKNAKLRCRRDELYCCQEGKNVANGSE